MRKLMRSISLLLVLLFGGIVINCYGSYTLVKKIYRWNGTLGNKYVNTVVHWALLFVQVYTIAGVVDYVFLNPLEFWTGSNPLAMGPSDSETRIVKIKKRTFEITATQNQFDIRELKDNKMIHHTVLAFDTSSSNWYVKTENKTFKVAHVNLDDKNTLELFHPDGTSVNVEIN